MGVTYTNRKGVTYYLCAGKTKRGGMRYYFAAKPRGEPVRKIPPGYVVTESVNAVVSLARPQPLTFRQNEITAVQNALQRHPDSRSYRVVAKRSHIEVYESIDRGAKEVTSDFVRMGILSKQKAPAAVASQERDARYAPVLRFTLFDIERRTFVVERMTYRGNGGWLPLGHPSPLWRLADRVIPTLGTDAFFDLF